MTEIVRKAGVVWNGDLKNGGGMISTESRVLYEQPYNFSTRFENAPGTNPEELIAAAHAACYSMALASTLQSKDGGFEITRMMLHARAQVPGIDNNTFQRLAVEADKGCPVSNLLRDGAQIDLKAELIAGPPSNKAAH